MFEYKMRHECSAYRFLSKILPVVLYTFLFTFVERKIFGIWTIELKLYAAWIGRVGFRGFYIRFFR